MATDPEARTKVVEELYRLFSQGRLQETFDLMHPDVVLQEPGDPAAVPWAGTFRGHPGLRQFYDALGAALQTIEIDSATLRLVPVGRDQVLALGTERGVAAGTGRTYRTESAWLWTVRDGQITNLKAYHDTAAMAAAMKT